MTKPERKPVPKRPVSSHNKQTEEVSELVVEENKQEVEEDEFQEVVGKSDATASASNKEDDVDLTSYFSTPKRNKENSSDVDEAVKSSEKITFPKMTVGIVSIFVLFGLLWVIVYSWYPKSEMYLNVFNSDSNNMYTSDGREDGISIKDDFTEYILNGGEPNSLVPKLPGKYVKEPTKKDIKDNQVKSIDALLLTVSLEKGKIDKRLEERADKIISENGKDVEEALTEEEESTTLEEVDLTETYNTNKQFNFLDAEEYPMGDNAILISYNTLKKNLYQEFGEGTVVPYTNNVASKAIENDHLIVFNYEYGLDTVRNNYPFGTRTQVDMNKVAGVPIYFNREDSEIKVAYELADSMAINFKSISQIAPIFDADISEEILYVSGVGYSKLIIKTPNDKSIEFTYDGEQRTVGGYNELYIEPDAGIVYDNRIRFVINGHEFFIKIKNLSGTMEGDAILEAYNM